MLVRATSFGLSDEVHGLQHQLREEDFRLASLGAVDPDGQAALRLGGIARNAVGLDVADGQDGLAVPTSERLQGTDSLDYAIGVRRNVEDHRLNIPFKRVANGSHSILSHSPAYPV